jgi:hypothetical protein
MNNLEKMMVFRIIKYAVINKILGPNQNGLFRTIGYPLKEIGADEILNNKRAVSFYFSQGDLNRGSVYRPIHDPVFLFELFVTADAKADLKVLEKNFEGDFQQKAYFTALNSMQKAESQADFLLDELIDIVYQLVMRKENDQLAVDRLGLSVKRPISNRMIFKIQKQTKIQNVEKSGLVTVWAQMFLKCRFNEKVIGIIPDADKIGAGAEFHIDLEVNNDSITKAGVLADTT